MSDTSVIIYSCSISNFNVGDCLLMKTIYWPLDSFDCILHANHIEPKSLFILIHVYQKETKNIPSHKKDTFYIKERFNMIISNTFLCIYVHPGKYSYD